MNILETEDELKNCEECQYFSFSGQTHLIKVIKCYDGDTLYCIFKHDGGYYKFKIRMDGYDTAEMKPSRKIPDQERDEIKKRALEAKKRLEELTMNQLVYLECREFDKYGRILGVIKRELDDKKSVNDMMIEEGHGVVYHGGTKNINGRENINKGENIKRAKRETK